MFRWLGLGRPLAEAMTELKIILFSKWRKCFLGFVKQKREKMENKVYDERTKSD